MTALITITVDGESVDVEVLYRSQRGVKSSRDAYGLPAGPDDDDEIRILEIGDGPNGPIKRTREIEQQIEDAIRAGDMQPV